MARRFGVSSHSRTASAPKRWFGFAGFGLPLPFSPKLACALLLALASSLVLLGCSFGSDEQDADGPAERKNEKGVKKTQNANELNTQPNKKRAQTREQQMEFVRLAISKGMPAHGRWSLGPCYESKNDETKVQKLGEGEKITKAVQWSKVMKEAGKCLTLCHGQVANRGCQFEWGNDDSNHNGCFATTGKVWLADSNVDASENEQTGAKGTLCWVNADFATEFKRAQEFCSREGCQLAEKMSAPQRMSAPQEVLADEGETYDKDAWRQVQQGRADQADGEDDANQADVDDDANQADGEDNADQADGGEDADQAVESIPVKPICPNFPICLRAEVDETTGEEILEGPCGCAGHALIKRGSKSNNTCYACKVPCEQTGNKGPCYRCGGQASCYPGETCQQGRCIKLMASLAQAQNEQNGVNEDVISLRQTQTQHRWLHNARHQPRSAVPRTARQVPTAAWRDEDSGGLELLEVGQRGGANRRTRRGYREQQSPVSSTRAHLLSEFQAQR